MPTASAKREAIDAIVRHARDVARLPPFPTTAVLRAVVTDEVRGELVPRASDAWLALLPFDDLTDDASMPDLIDKRRAFVETLATIARPGASQFPFDTSSSMHRGEGTQDPVGADNTFWSDVMRKLDPEADPNRSREMARSLVAMSHAESLRFLFNVTHEVVPDNFPEMLERMLGPRVDAKKTSVIDEVLELCGASNEKVKSQTVEIALNFSNTKVSPALLVQVLDVIARCSQQRVVSRCGVAFCVTSLRFGCDCVFKAKDIELLGQRQSLLPIKELQLGDMYDIKRSALRLGITNIMKQTSGLRRLVATSLNVFRVIASTLRSGDTGVEELEAAFEPTVENAVWLAFSVFHVDSKSSVSSLRLRVPTVNSKRRLGGPLTAFLNDEWLAAFKRALQSLTAGKDLAGLKPDEECEDNDISRRMVTLKVGTPVKTEPYPRAKLECKIDDGTHAFEAIASTHNSVAVIVPGLGVGWVSKASITSEQLVDSRISREIDQIQTNGTVTSFVWDYPALFYPPGSKPTTVLLEILQIIGQPLKRLHIPGVRLTSNELGQVLASCPNLVELNMCGHTARSIAPLVDAYATGNCKIETLNAVVSRLGRYEDSILREMVKILEGPGRARLRRLAVQMAPILNALAPIKNDAMALARVLDSNTTLEYIQLPGLTHWVPFRPVQPFFERDYDEPAPTSDISVDISAHPYCTIAMPPSAKLAFLSCLQNTSSALGRLDATIVGLIFRFSSHLIARQVITDEAVVPRHHAPRVLLFGQPVPV